jgi:hypothetical protein
VIFAVGFVASARPRSRCDQSGGGRRAGRRHRKPRDREPGDGHLPAPGGGRVRVAHSIDRATSPVVSIAKILGAIRMLLSSTAGRIVVVVGAFAQARFARLLGLQPAASSFCVSASLFLACSRGRIPSVIEAIGGSARRFRLGFSALAASRSAILAAITASWPWSPGT